MRAQAGEPRRLRCPGHEEKGKATATLWARGDPARVGSAGARGPGSRLQPAVPAWSLHPQRSDAACRLYTLVSSTVPFTTWPQWDARSSTSKVFSCCMASPCLHGIPRNHPESTRSCL